MEMLIYKIGHMLIVEVMLNDLTGYALLMEMNGITTSKMTLDIIF
jgi:hypothetical protein